MRYVLWALLVVKASITSGVDKKAIAQSTIILEVNVTEYHKSNVNFLSSGDSVIKMTASINKVFEKPQVLSLSGQDRITILNKRVSSFRDGKDYIVFGVVAVAGNNVAIFCLDAIEPDQLGGLDLPRLKQAIDAQQKVEDARCVLIARVNTIGRQAQRPNIEFEHEAFWHHYELNIQEILYGTIMAERIKVSVPRSKDALWIGGPSLEEGAEYIFYLQQIPGTSSFEIYEQKHLAKLNERLKIQRDVAYAERCAICD
ncbi:MAG: hypothetical protein KDC92_06605 [Bacteroidetes bacterium]|nr:hypothetical protein [Bacteroidota bacterium]